VVKKFDARPVFGRRAAWEELAGILADKGCVVEVNTSGLFHPVGQMYPGPEILGILAQRGVAVTLGSDAHGPDEVGRGFDAAVKALKAVGISEITTFCRRKQARVRLP